MCGRGQRLDAGKTLDCVDEAEQRRIIGLQRGWVWLERELRQPAGLGCRQAERLAFVQAVLIAQFHQRVGNALNPCQWHRQVSSVLQAYSQVFAGDEAQRVIQPRRRSFRCAPQILDQRRQQVDGMAIHHDAEPQVEPFARLLHPSRTTCARRRSRLQIRIPIIRRGYPIREFRIDGDLPSQGSQCRYSVHHERKPRLAAPRGAAKKSIELRVQFPLDI